MENAIELRDLTMGYGNHTILRNLYLNIKVGEFVSIFGENGAGKTTLFKGILQLLPIMKGNIKIFNVDVTKSNEKTWLRSQIGYVPQRHNQGNFPITVFEATLLGRWGSSFSYFKKPSAEDKEVAKDILQLVDLSHLSHQDCRRLSGGQIQRLNIARALARHPRILLLDEPNTHLDIESQQKLDNILHSIRKEYHLSILMISHDQLHTRRVSDRVVHLRNGTFQKDLELVI
ncbi:metal ABC transporter ATP-binding protein [Alkaliphilus serpentinus]|nr:metal ABC transporter ATP-binding protein [Alkaliphilus serpentinus]